MAAAVDAAGAGALAPGAEIVVPLPVPVAAGDTLAGVARRFAVTAAELGETNADADALSPGAAVVLPDGGQVTAAAHDTLGSIAAAHGTTAGDLAAANATAGGLLRPGAVLTSGYRARAGDTPGGVAAAFGLTAAALGAANAEVPGLLVAEQSVLLGQDARPVGQGDTFASIAADTGVTVASLATANATVAGLLVPGQTIAMPRHVVLGGSAHQAGAADTLGAIARPQRRAGRPRWAAPTPTSPACWPSACELSYTPPGGRPPYATTTRRTTPCRRWRCGCSRSSPPTGSASRSPRRCWPRPTSRWPAWCRGRRCWSRRPTSRSARRSPRATPRWCSRWKPR